MARDWAAGLAKRRLPLPMTRAATCIRNETCRIDSDGNWSDSKPPRAIHVDSRDVRSIEFLIP